MPHPSECQITPQVFGQVYCQNFNCSKRATYSIGKQVGPPSLKMHLCEQCTLDLLVNALDDLWDQAAAKRVARRAAEEAEEAIIAAARAAEEEAAKPVFTCSKCGATFKNALTAQGHENKCTGGGD